MVIPMLLCWIPVITVPRLRTVQWINQYSIPNRKYSFLTCFIPLCIINMQTYEFSIALSKILLVETLFFTTLSIIDYTFRSHLTTFKPNYLDCITVIIFHINYLNRCNSTSRWVVILQLFQNYNHVKSLVHTA